MSERVKLYYQCSGDLPLWDFCLHAWYGARQNNIPAIKFERAEDIPNSPYHIVVGSVEECRKWLEINGYESPLAISERMRYYLYSKVYASCTQFIVNNLSYPTFIKPSDVIKSFTGTVVKDKAEAVNLLNGLNCGIETKPVVDFKSEWRCYIHKGELIKTCHYLGDPLITPSSEFLSEVVFRANQTKLDKYNSYTIDIGFSDTLGFLQGGVTDWVVIEFNDAWAIGNYGLDSDQYYHFLKDRWFQLTGALPYKTIYE
jgi:hypothetical protein